MFCLARLAFIPFSIGLAIGSAHADPYVLSDHEMEAIRLGLSLQMLDPSSTIISDVVSVTDGKFKDNGATVCGFVRGKNTFGGYAQPTPFIGILADTKSGQRKFLPIAVAEPSPTSQLSILQMCRTEIAAGSKPRLSKHAEPVQGKDWDDCIRKLCVSTSQGDCWVKAGSEICSDDGHCAELSEHSPSIVGELRGQKWHVHTETADGWVSARMMMIDSSSCTY